MSKNYFVGDEAKQLYSTGEVAEVIGRTSQTLRRWEKLKIIPPAPYTIGERGFGKQGKRLFGGLHRDTLRAAAIATNLKQGKPIDKVFAQMVVGAYKEIAEGKYPKLLQDFNNKH